MNILATQYTLANKALEVYLAGCKGNPHCEGCHNPESWDFSIGRKYNEMYFSEIRKKVLEFNSLIENIMIFGGEPFDQDTIELQNLVRDLSKLKRKLWVFTRFDLSILFQKFPRELLESFDYIKCGRYIKELATDNKFQYGIKITTSNQHIYKKGIDY